MMAEQLTPEQREDASVLKERLLEPKVRAALERLLAQQERSIFDEYERGDQKKAWLRGARHVLQDVLPSILQIVQDSEAAEQEEEQDKKILRGESAEGSSDLAI